MRRLVVLLSRHVAIFIVVLLSIVPTLAQTSLRGGVRDAISKRPIVGATIQCLEYPEGSSTNSSGSFYMKLDSTILEIVVSAMGYKKKNVLVTGKDSTLLIYLEKEDHLIETVEIVKRGKYKNNNPATELIDLVIRNKRRNQLTHKDSLYFQQYDKIKFGMVDPQNGFKTKMGDMSFFFKDVDTTSLPGHELLTLYLQEDLSDNYIRQRPTRTKKIIRAQHKTEFDPRYVNNPNVSSYLNYLFQPVDIYDESIFFINKLFLSPIADNAKLYYKYYITDTLRTEKEIFAVLRFEPRNKSDLLFKGSLVVSLDARYAVKRASLEIDEKTNISWVNSFKVDLSYFKNTEGVMLQDSSNVFVVFGRGKVDAVFGERSSVHYRYDTHHVAAENTFSGAPVELRLDSGSGLDGQRPVPLSTYEARTYANIDSLNDLKSFKTLLAAGYLVAQGYYPVGKFELGPLEYLYHRNEMEGDRIRFGGRTTAKFSEKVYLEGYMAYGFQDEQFKYYLRTAIALNGKSVATFPAHYLEGSVQRDIFEPGKAIGYLKGDSFFRSFRSNKPTKWLDTEAYRFGHVVEFGNHFSLSSTFTHQKRTAIGDLRFVLTADSTKSLANINTNDVQFTLRWAPFEKFYYRNLQRRTIIESQPVFSLQYNKGLDGFFGGAYNYDALRFSASKRFFMNQLGFADITFTAGKIWGTLPYPLLEMPNIQEMKDRHTISYEMTNSMEFVADQFLKLSYDHELNGFLLNKLPLIKKLRFREIFGGRMFYGRLSANNNPSISDKVVYFDTHKEGYTVTHALQKSPYWEGYVGLDNILSIFRVQYFYRFNYRYHPNITNERFKLSLNFNF
ncbi:CarboxypepD_reg-like domain-containing protein [Sphingobacterium nematocida]|uniref:CarboxypepD_reg-like domain-containing protein n=1 Tax=Sphingobacterium nematocida TaxID=1513896 RepID=A0A1T5G528_9SPHI|nr:DUF5686 family protein [Sphingobacterium nematocida]SKC03437.1 CarboxypepD_reg-like domain-containing protein [Sphingobacterium nematocida]